MADNSFKFGLQDVKISSWTNATTWGTAQDVEAVSEMTINVQTVSGVLEGDDALADAHAKIISATVSIQFGFKALEAWAILTGATHESSSSNDAMTFDTTNMPFFAIAGRIDDTDATGNDILFIPKMKLMEGFELGMRYGQYMTPSIQGMAIRNDSIYGVLRILQYAADTPVTIVPALITA